MEKLLKKRLLTVIMAVVLTISMVPSVAMAKTSTFGEAKKAATNSDIWSSITHGGITVSVSTTIEFLQIASTGAGQYAISSTMPGYFPKHFSMKIEPNAQVTGTNGAKFEYYNAPYGVVTMGDEAAVLTVTDSNGNSFSITCPKAIGGGTSGEGLYAYLPAYGQFANEGINSGGWGDGYVSGTTGRKAMVNTVAQTGLSLGSFGGYAVLKFDTPVANSSKNKYGVDFILYGNAFVGNAEPGCVQVSQDGHTWYDIAGSKHYAAETVWNASATYINPHPEDNQSVNDTDGTFMGNNSYTYNVTLPAGPGASPNPELVIINHNNWHTHSWFPLERNYFNVRKAGDLPLANLAECNAFASYANNSLNLTGTKIRFEGAGAEAYQFGYCDVHPNGSNLGTAVNPYTIAANANSGGDGIDISWAVNENGEPVYLDNISYVRVYTGVANFAGVFGETSTELCGAYVVSPENTEVGVTDATVSFDGISPDDFVSMGYATVEQISSNVRMYTVSSGGSTLPLQISVLSNPGDKVYINGKAQTQIDLNFSPTESKYAQIIVQNGNKEPNIVLVKSVW